MATTTSPPLPLHPAILFFCEQLTCALTGGFTSPRSPLRFLGLIIVSGCVWMALTTGLGHFDNKGWAPRTFVGAHPAMLMLFIDRLLMKKWSFETGVGDPDDHSAKALGDKSTKRTATQPKSGTADKIDTFRTRLSYGFDFMDSTRGVGTPWEVKNVPHFSTQDPSYLPSRSMFLLRRALAAVICYYVHNYLMGCPYWESTDILLKPSHVPFLSRLGKVSLEETVMRARATAMFLTETYCFLQFFYSASAVVNVSFKPQELPLWRPLFGPFSEMYSMRHFWGVTWHQTLRRNLTAFANLFTYSILHLPRGTLVARYTHIFFAFFASGLLHVVSDLGGGVAVRDSGSLSFFCLQALGIMLEDGVQDVYRRIRGPSRAGPIEKGLLRAVGYVWVAVFLTWSGPGWIYPWLQVGKKADNMLSFGNFRSVLPF